MIYQKSLHYFVLIYIISGVLLANNTYPLSDRIFLRGVVSASDTTRISIEDKAVKDADINNLLPGFQKGPYFNEQVRSFNFLPEVKVHINAPEKLDRSKKVSLILFALPNGNTTEQTIGKKLEPGDDWHYDIQHIGAQTRFLREHIKDQNIVVAYLETEGKSWPAWRRKTSGNSVLIKSIVDSLRNMFSGYDTRITLTGHSGGGSFIFGFLNSVDTIPDYIERIGFLDSDYAYDDSLKHGEKLAQWLKSSDQKYLCVIAYNDSVVIFNGKPLVSPTGGTWYRSKLMKSFLQNYFSFTSYKDTSMIQYSSPDNRIKFFLKENPKGEIYHTVQVERNGFIEAILSGTALDEKDYKYFGERAYGRWIK